MIDGEDLFFTGDEHYHHAKIIAYAARPFGDVAEMDNELIKRHNLVVSPDDVVIHVGDFIMGGMREARSIIELLNGYHIFLHGSHDRWMKQSSGEDPSGKFCEVGDMYEEWVGQRLIVCCHYAMRVWPRSHYGSWQVYGHSHGRLPPTGKQWDVGVDNNAFAPLSFDELAAIMAKQPDNANLVRR